MTELTHTINNVNDITSLQEIINNNTTNITTLQSYTVSSGTNFGVRPDVFDNLTTRTQNTAIGNLASRGLYRLTTGSGNVIIQAVAVKVVPIILSLELIHN